MKTLLFLLLSLITFQAIALEYGIDRLEESEVIEKFQNKNLAVLTHSAGVDENGTHLIDRLYRQYSLKKIFAPEHGLRTLADDWVNDGVDQETGLPVISLYKRGSKSPSPEDLKDIDAIVIDLQDVGVRYYTYFSTIAEVMKTMAPLKKEVILLDRPNLLGGNIIEGKTLDPELAGSFTAYHTVPTRHGMTLGELALMINAEKNWNANLSVISVKGWKREMLIPKLEREWIAPSPALIEINQVLLYALWGTLENFNLAVGRGQINDKAFKIIGAPWITDAEKIELADQLNSLGFPGVTFVPFEWKVDRALYNGQIARGVMIQGDASFLRTDEFTFKVASLLVRLFSDRISHNNMSPQAYGSKSMIEAIRKGLSWESYELLIDKEIEDFKIRRIPYLLY
jgi:uncharacterized protein YbbC (DUF1343 family)